ncbi:MAG: hypothetical protein ABI995_15585 [Acidobacteriota bacterium]
MKLLQTIFVAFALVVASCQCALACTAEPGRREQVPPCHRHSHPQQPGDTQEKCLHTQIVVDRAAASVSLDSFALPPAEVAPSDVAGGWGMDGVLVAWTDSSPENPPDLLLSTLLRV